MTGAAGIEAQGGDVGQSSRTGAHDWIAQVTGAQIDSAANWAATLPSGAEVTAAVTDVLRNDLALARRVDAVFKDPDFVAFMEGRVSSGDPAGPVPDLDQIQTAVRQIVNEIGARPSDKNALVRWGLNFWQVAKTTGLISVLGFGLRTGIQVAAAQSMELGQPDQKTELAEGVYYSGQAVSSLIMLTSTALNVKDKNWDAATGDLLYALSMLGAVGFAKSYDVAASLSTSMVGAAFYASFTEILKTFRTMKVPQLAGVRQTGKRKIGAYAAGAAAFTASFIPATAWSYSNDYVGAAKFADQDAAKIVRKGVMFGLLWGGALVGYSVLTPPLVKLVTGNQSGAIGPLEYEAEWNKDVLQKSPKEILKTALQVANDANRFFAFVQVFNTFLALDGVSRLGQAGKDAIPNDALRIFANTVVSSIFCLGLCYIYEMQYAAKTQQPSEVLTEGSEGHVRVEAALNDFYSDILAAEAPIPQANLPQLIEQHAAGLETDAESALFYILVYAQVVPRALEEELIVSVPPAPALAPAPVAAPAPAHSEPTRSDRDDPAPREDSPVEDMGARPKEETLAMTRMASSAAAVPPGSASSAAEQPAGGLDPAAAGKRSDP